MLKTMYNHIFEYFKGMDIAEEETCLETEVQSLNEATKVDDFKFNMPDLEVFSGTVTRLTDDLGYIDDDNCFKPSSCAHLDLKVGDTVYYQRYKPISESSPYNARVTKLIQRSKRQDGADRENDDRSGLKEHSIIGRVTERNGMLVVVDSKDVDFFIEFDLDQVSSNFTPITDDLIQLSMSMEDTENFNPANGDLFSVTRIEPAQTVIKTGNVTKVDSIQKCGEIDGEVYFSNDTCDYPMTIKVGDSVSYEAIETEPCPLIWRAITLKISEAKAIYRKITQNRMQSNEIDGISVQDNLDSRPVKLKERRQFTVEITNNNSESRFFVKASILGRVEVARLSQLNSIKNRTINANETIRMNFAFEGWCLGKVDRDVKFYFKDHTLKRRFVFNVVDDDCEQIHNDGNYVRTQCPRKAMGNIDLNANHRPAVYSAARIKKPPPFVRLRMDEYRIPNGFFQNFIEKNATSSLEELIVFLRCEYSYFDGMLTPKNYKDRFHGLLYLEEIEMAMQYATFRIDRTFLLKRGEFLVLTIENLSDRRPTMQLEDRVIIKNPWSEKEKSFEGVVHRIIDDDVYLMFNSIFHERYNNNDVTVDFKLNRNNYKRHHFAIDMAHSVLGPRILFPDRLVLSESRMDICEPDEFESKVKWTATRDRLKLKKVVWFNDKLNHVQKEAVKNALAARARPLPYIIFGPPGTGKTVTLIEIIMQIWRHEPESRILIGTPSNSAANLITQRLVETGKFEPGTLVRLLSQSFANRNLISDSIKEFCQTSDIGVENTVRSKAHIDENGIKKDYDRTYFIHQRVTVGTCTIINDLARMDLGNGHYTHVLIDEAGQATEAEVMIPLSLIDGQSGQIILCGDPKQLGPIVLSKTACDLGSEVSYMERLLDRFPYRKDLPGRNYENGGYNKNLVTKLIFNYRSLPKIVELSSKLFYDNDLMPKVDPTQPEVVDILNNLSKINELKNRPEIIFYGVRGFNYREQNRSSWLNPQEASTVVDLLCKLYRNGFTHEDVGIITPYSQQVKYIRKRIADIDQDCPKIGSVEEFQGQERKIVLLSTVRSNEDLKDVNTGKFLSFVNNPKRINVALTRAQFLLIIVGNPYILSMDPMWKSILEHIEDMGGLTGVHL